ncbi:MAG: leucine-rich repeat domain-containing protein [Oscillospiraceae bacterium]|nr:leucine-rich repeat domain-containing protein [Oscillospiraceae bacterium]
MRTRMKKYLILLSALLLSTLALSSCGGREKSGNLEFIYDAESDSYTLNYYTDSSSMKELVIPDTFNEKPVTAIGRLAIASCDTLEKVVIGPNIADIHKWGVVDCRYLKAIEVSEENAHFKSVDGVLYSKDGAKLITYPNAHTAEYAADGKLLQSAEYTIEAGTSVIGHCAFYKTYGLAEVILPPGVEIIEERAFHKSAITKINFPEGLAFIGKDAFLGCEGLTAITLPSTIREIGEYAFYNAYKIKSVTILAKEAEVTQGNKWAPTSAGKAIAVEVIWG